MSPAFRLLVVFAGFLALTASLLGRKKAGWCAAVGGVSLVYLAVADSDPVLALGGVVLCLTRLLPVKAPGRSGQPLVTQGRHGAPVIGASQDP